MRAVRSSVLVALVLASAIATVVSPAFATPNLSASSGTSAVAPFITPVTSTTSLFTGRTGDLVMSIDSLGVSATCRTSVVSGYVGSTHTQARLTSIVFGSGARGDCSVRTPGGNGTIDNDRVSCAVNSTTPGFFGVQNLIRGVSWQAWMWMNACFYFTTVGGMSCRVDVPGQWVIGTFTSNRSQIELSNAATPGSSSSQVSITDVRGCLLTGRFTGTIAATFVVRPDTRRDSLPTITAAS
jgi:hypothetical protein